MKRTLPPLGVLIVLSACTSGQESTPTAPEPAIVEVSVGRTPGKPMEFVKPHEPAEHIQARRAAQGYELVVTRNVGSQEQDYVQTTVALAAEEWEQILELVADEGLRTWKPKPSSGQPADWGEARLGVKTTEGEHARSWIKPLDNAGPADALFLHLAKLARAKVKRPPLYYMPE